MFCLALIGGPLLIWFAGPDYWTGIEKAMGTEYADALKAIMPPWMLYVGLALLFCSGLVGAFLGRRILRKHFVRAGIA